MLSSPEAAHFPKTNAAMAFVEYKYFSSPGRPIRVPIEDWAGAKKRVAEDAAWAQWLAKERAETEDWMERREDRVEWIAGWWHDFVSPQDGSTLTWTPDEPGENTLFSPSDPEVKLTARLHGGWVFMFRRRHGKEMLNAARLYRLTGEKKYAEWTMKQLDFYADNFHQWPDQFRGKGIWVSRAHLMHQPLDEAVNLISHINAAVWVEAEVAPERKQNWIDKLFRPQAELLDESFQSIHNIACWQRSGMAHVALYTGDEALWKRAIDARFGIRSQLREGVTSDYLWHEQSLGYNYYVVTALQPLFEFASRAGRLEELREEAEIAENLMLAPLALRFGDGRLPTPADSSMTRVNFGIMADSAHLFPTNIGLHEAAKRHNWNTLIDPPITLPHSAAPQELPSVRGRNLESSRMAVLRNGDWQVFFHYGQIHASHSQTEALNFEATYGETDITHDAGTVGYGSPLHRDYFTTGLAHNIPLIDSVGQSDWNPGTLIEFDAASGRVEAMQPYPEGATATRALHIENNIVRDVVSLQTGPEASASLRLGLALHLQGEVQLPAAFVAAKQFAAQRPAAFAFWNDVRGATFQESASFEVVYPTCRMRVTFQVRGEFRVYHADTPDAPPRRRESFYLETTGQQAQFVTTFEPLF